jgi:cobalt-zinc-cadmium efflux system membrane fusion protein
MVTILSGLEPGQRIATANAFLLKSELEKEGAEHGH